MWQWTISNASCETLWEGPQEACFFRRFWRQRSRWQRSPLQKTMAPINRYPLRRLLVLISSPCGIFDSQKWVYGLEKNQCSFFQIYASLRKRKNHRALGRESYLSFWCNKPQYFTIWNFFSFVGGFSGSDVERKFVHRRPLAMRVFFLFLQYKPLSVLLPQQGVILSGKLQKVGERVLEARACI